VADGALQGSGDWIIFLSEGSQNTTYRYCNREHLILSCVVTHKLARTGPKCSEELFIF
jgi:hypothetical protein